MTQPTTSVHYDATTTNAVEYQPGQRIALKGTIKEVLDQKDIMRQEKKIRLVKFLLLINAGSGRKPHLFTIKAFSDTGHDRFNIAGRLGEELTCYCYLNGLDIESSKGNWRENELSLHSMN